MTFGIDFARLRRADSGPALVDPATLPLTMWLDARDATGGGAGTLTWNGRTSLSSSGMRGYFRRSGASAHPSLSYINTKPSVSFGGNAGGALRAIAAPGTILAASSVLGTTEFWWSCVVQFAAQANGGAVYAAPNSGPFSCDASGLGATLRQAGGSLIQTVYDGSYEETAVTQTAGVQVLVQGRFRSSTGVLEIRVGKNAFVTEPTDAALNLTGEFLLASSMGLLGDWTGHIQELMGAQAWASNTELNDIADRAASIWGVSV